MNNYPNIQDERQDNEFEENQKEFKIKRGEDLDGLW